MVGITQSLQVADDLLRSFVCRETVGRHDEAVIAACHAVVDAVTVAPEICRRIAEAAHSLGERHELRRKGHGDAVIEHSAVLCIHSRLDGGEGWISELCGGKLLSERKPLREETGSIGHVCRKIRTHNFPRESVNEEIEHETTAMRCMADGNRCTDDEIVRRGEIRCLAEPKEIRRRRAQESRAVRMIGSDANLLCGFACPEEGQHDFLRRAQVDMGTAVCTRATHEIK